MPEDNFRLDGFDPGEVGRRESSSKHQVVPPSADPQLQRRLQALRQAARTRPSTACGLILNLARRPVHQLLQPRSHCHASFLASALLIGMSGWGANILNWGQWEQCVDFFIFPQTLH